MIDHGARPSWFQPSALSPLAAPQPPPQPPLQHSASPFSATPAPNVFGLAPAPVPWSWQQWLSMVHPNAHIIFERKLPGLMHGCIFIDPPKKCTIYHLFSGMLQTLMFFGCYYTCRTIIWCGIVCWQMEFRMILIQVSPCLNIEDPSNMALKAWTLLFGGRDFRETSGLGRQWY